MAAIDLSVSAMENPEFSDTYEVAFQTGHVIGQIVKPDGTVTGSVSDPVGGVVVRPGDSTLVPTNRTLILRKGLLRGVQGAGAAINAVGWNDGAGGVTDTEPAGAAGTDVTQLGVMISATRMFFDVSPYELGA